MPNTPEENAIEMQQDEATKERLEYLRGELRAERISQLELNELMGLAEFIDPGDTELLEAAGVPEFPEDDGNELLSALEEAKEMLCKIRAANTGTWGLTPVIEQVEAAIAKAGGQPNIDNPALDIVEQGFTPEQEDDGGELSRFQIKTEEKVYFEYIYEVLAKTEEQAIEIFEDGGFECCREGGLVGSPADSGMRITETQEL